MNKLLYFYGIRENKRYDVMVNELSAILTSEKTHQDTKTPKKRSNSSRVVFGQLTADTSSD